MDDAYEELARKEETEANACQAEALQVQGTIELLRHLKQKYPSVIDELLSKVDCSTLLARLDDFEQRYGEGKYADYSDYCTAPYYDY
jgi:hypothetical protein